MAGGGFDVETLDFDGFLEGVEIHKDADEGVGRWGYGERGDLVHLLRPEERDEIVGGGGHARLPELTEVGGFLGVEAELRELVEQERMHNYLAIIAQLFHTGIYDSYHGHHRQNSQLPYLYLRKVQRFQDPIVVLHCHKSMHEYGLLHIQNQGR